MSQKTELATGLADLIATEFAGAITAEFANVPTFDLADLAERTKPAVFCAPAGHVVTVRSRAGRTHGLAVDVVTLSKLTGDADDRDVQTADLHDLAEAIEEFAAVQTLAIDGRIYKWTESEYTTILAADHYLNANQYTAVLTATYQCNL